jgi:hypothetical protein
LILKTCLGIGTERIRWFRGFVSGNVFFINHFDAQYNSWSGFAYTNHTDTITKDFSNQYSSIFGKGAEGSQKYGVFYFTGVPDTLVFSVPEKVTDIAFCNSAYAYHSIKYGNQFCKKFGGATGNDQDWFKLTLTAIDNDEMRWGLLIDPC